VSIGEREKTEAELLARGAAIPAVDEQEQNLAVASTFWPLAIQLQTQATRYSFVRTRRLSLGREKSLAKEKPC
jgi:hypothetical protein